MIDSKKTSRDLYLYFWFGIAVYVSSCVLDVIHLYQAKGRQPIDFFFYLVLLSVNLSLIAKIKRLSNLARHLFIAKVILLVSFYYPQIILAESGGWVYSGHWPHGMFQRVANMMTIVFEIYMLTYLFRRSVRFVFVHKDDEVIQDNMKKRKK